MDERTIMAIGRLEHALSRLETLADAPPPAPPPPEDDEARARHLRLRESTQAAIARLDTLLGPR